jgi:hypothetical protein
MDLFNPVPSSGKVRRALARILCSPEFSRTTRTRELLVFIVERALDGKVDELSGEVIAREIFKRGSDYDPETDSIVRTDIARLRARLADYYAGSGSRDQLRIMLNRVDYLPVFEVRQPVGWHSLSSRLRDKLLLIAALASVIVVIIALAVRVLR